MLNKIILMGRLTRDPELRKTANGTAVTSFSLAVDRDYKPQDGERETDFIDVVAWRGTAEFVFKYFSKGRMAVVEGRLQVRDWKDQDGNNRRSYEVIADNVYFGDSKRSESGTPAEPSGEIRGDPGAAGGGEGRAAVLTTMDYAVTLRAMRTLKVQTGSLTCLDCPYEDGCSVHGCAILRNAREHMVDLELALRSSEQARSDLARQLAAAQKELAEVKAERDAAYRRLGGEPPKTCKTCDLWGKAGWSQHEIGYCEGDDHPHGPDDFCSRHCQQKEA